MATENFPNDPRNDAYGANLTDSEFSRSQRIDNQLQPDPELAEGPATTGKVAVFALGIAVLLGAVFYGLNNSSTGSNQASNPPATQSAQAPADNSAPGVTTGAATNRPTAPASSATGTEINRSATPSTGKTSNDTN